jgi:hypothetical protein
MSDSKPPSVSPEARRRYYLAHRDKIRAKAQKSTARNAEKNRERAARDPAGELAELRAVAQMCGLSWEEDANVE